MKKVTLLLALVAVAGIASAANLLTNSSFETYADDGYGRIMPTGYGLWTPDWGTVGGDAHVVTTDARTGLASMQIGTDGGDVALTFGLGILPVGDYVVSGYFKGTGGVNALIGVDMFAPDWSSWWWGGFTAVGDNADWTQFSFGFHSDGVPAWNFAVKGVAGTADFLVDDVSASLVVPEPATMLLLGLGGMLLRRKK